MKSGSFLIPAIFTIFTIAACGKSGGSGKPQITLVSIDHNPVKFNDSLVLHFKFTGSSVGSGVFVSIRNRINQVPVSDPSGSDTLVNPIPDLEGASKGEFRYALETNGYLFQSTQLKQNDTIYMKFFVLTSNNNHSDTITSPKIIALMP
jgi:hypothetical protein